MKLSPLLIAIALAACATGPRPDDPRRAFLGSAAAPSEIIAAELAFARMAREKGTWTAFRETSTADAVWASPGWVNVRTSLKGQADPAEAIVWEPDSVVVSCDGSFALSTGPARYPNGRTSRFATIWQRQSDGGYKWVIDLGFDLEADYRKPEMIAAKVAQCGERRRGPPLPPRRGEAWQASQSDDGTLRWRTTLNPDCSRETVVEAAEGEAYREVFRRSAAAPPAKPGEQPPRCTA